MKSLGEEKAKETSQMPPPRSSLCPAMVLVNPAMFFNIMVDHKPLGCTSFKLFADKVPQTAENILFLSTREKGFGYREFCFHRMIPGLMCQGGDFTGNNGTGHKPISSEEKYGDKNFILKHTGPGILSWQMLDPTHIVPRFSSALPRQSGWMTSNVVSHQAKDGMDVKVARERFGPGMARPGRRSPLLTVDKSNTFDLCFTFTTRLSPP